MSQSNIAMAGGPRAAAVLQVLPALETGGVERGTVDVAAALVRNGWRAIVASSGGAMVRELDRAGAVHVTLPVHSKSPFVMARNAARLSGLIAAHDIAIVHARSRAPAWSAEWAASRRRRPFLTTFHGTYDAGTPAKRWYNSVMTRGRPVIAISEFVADHIRAIYCVDEARLLTIPRGVNVHAFDPAAVSAERIVKLARDWRLPDGVPVIMLPGRLTRWKGQLVLIEAMARLGRGDVCCLIVGADQGRRAYRAELEAAIRRRELGGTAYIIDSCNDMPAALMLADVVVSASTDPEAFGRVAAEAQAMGRPVVATDHGGSRETVIDGATGWLVPPGDAAALAQALGEAIALGEAERAELAATARRHIAERFTVDRMCEQTLALYSSLLETGTAP